MGERVIAVKPSKNPTQKVHRTEDQMWVGAHTCVPARFGDDRLFPNLPPKAELCKQAKLPERVGRFFFTDLTRAEYDRRYRTQDGSNVNLEGNKMYEDYEEYETLEGASLEDLALAMEKYNLVQTAIGAGVGVVGGLIVPPLMRQWSTKATGFWPWAKIALPAVATGIVSYFLGKRYPAAAAGLAAVGAVATTGMAAAKLIGGDSASLTISFDGVQIPAKADTGQTLPAPGIMTTTATGPTLSGGLGVWDEADVVSLDGYVPVDEAALQGYVPVDEAALQGFDDDEVYLGDSGLSSMGTPDLPFLM